MKRTLIAGLLAGMAAFLWGFVYWTKLPMTNQVIRPLPGGEAMMATMAQANAPSAAYAHPVSEDAGDHDHSGQPSINLLVYRSGPSGGMGVTIGRGFGLCMLLGLLLATLASCGAPRGRGFGGRVLYVFLIGLVGAVATRWMDWNWFSFPVDYTLLRLGDELGATLLMGLVIAGVGKPCDHAACRGA